MKTSRTAKNIYRTSIHVFLSKNYTRPHLAYIDLCILLLLSLLFVSCCSIWKQTTGSEIFRAPKATMRQRDIVHIMNAISIRKRRLTDYLFNE